MTKLTTAEAAQRLRVSPREVRRLADSGALTGARFGSALVFDGDDVRRLQRQARGPGRIWSARTAWSALSLLDGAPLELIDQPRRSRLRARLRQLEPEQFHRLTARRAEVHRFHASDGALRRLSGALVATGISAAAEETVARRFDLAAVIAEKRLEGYLQGDLSVLIEQYRLAPDPAGNATVRLLPDLMAIDHLLGSVPVVAVDLMDSDDSRERSRGREVLRGLLDEL